MDWIAKKKLQIEKTNQTKDKNQKSNGNRRNHNMIWNKIGFHKIIQDKGIGIIGYMYKHT